MSKRRLSILNVGGDLSQSEISEAGVSVSDVAPSLTRPANAFKSTPNRRLSVLHMSPGPDFESSHSKKTNKNLLKAAALATLVASHSRRGNARSRQNKISQREAYAVQKHLIRIGMLSPGQHESGTTGPGEIQDKGGQALRECEHPSGECIDTNQNEINVDTGHKAHGKRSTVVRILDVIDMARKEKLENKVSSTSGDTQEASAQAKEQNMDKVCHAIGIPTDLSRSMRARMLDETSRINKIGNCSHLDIMLSSKKRRDIRMVEDDFVDRVPAASKRRASSVSPFESYHKDDINLSQELSPDEFDRLIEGYSIPWRDSARVRKWIRGGHQESQVLRHKQRQRHKRRRSLDIGRSINSSRYEENGILRMMDELRSDYDPQYRLKKIRDKLHEAMLPRWGDRFGEDTLYWERLHEVTEIFKTVATDRFGMVTRGEVARACHDCAKSKIPNCDLDNLLELCDPNDRGCLDLDEFAQWYSSKADAWVSQRRSDPEDEFNDTRLLRREMLYFDSSLREKILVFWELISRKVDDDIAAEDEDEDGNIRPKYHARTIKQEEYLEFNMNLQRFVALKIQNEPFNEELAIKVALREWEFDTRPRRGESSAKVNTSTTMTKDQFFRAMLQLVDAWSAERADTKSCHAFLDKLLNENTTVTTTSTGDEMRVWKWHSAVVQRRLIELKKNESRLRHLKAAVRSRARHFQRPASAPTSFQEENVHVTVTKPAVDKVPEMDQGLLDKTAARLSRRFSIYRNERKRLNAHKDFLKSARNQEAIDAARRLVHERGFGGHDIEDKLIRQESTPPRTRTPSHRTSMISLPEKILQMRSQKGGNSGVPVEPQNSTHDLTRVSEDSSKSSSSVSKESEVVRSLAESDNASKLTEQQDANTKKYCSEFAEGIKGPSFELSFPGNVSLNTFESPKTKGEHHLLSRPLTASPELRRLFSHTQPDTPRSIRIKGHGINEGMENIVVGPHIPLKYAMSHSKRERMISPLEREANANIHNFSNRHISIGQPFLVKSLSSGDLLPTSASKKYRSPSSRPGLYCKIREDRKWLQEDSLRQDLDFSDYIEQFDHAELCGSSMELETDIGENENSLNEPLHKASYSDGVSVTSPHTIHSRLSASNTASPAVMFQKMLMRLFNFLDIEKLGTLGQLELLALRSEIYTARFFVASVDGKPPKSVFDEYGSTIVTIYDIFDDILNSRRFKKRDIGLQRCILITIFTNAKSDSHGRCTRNILLDAIETLAKRITEAAKKVQKQRSPRDGLTFNSFSKIMRSPPEIMTNEELPNDFYGHQPPVVALNPEQQYSRELFKNPRDFSDGLMRSVLKPSVPPGLKCRPSVTILNMKPKGRSKIAAMYNPSRATTSQLGRLESDLRSTNFD